MEQYHDAPHTLDSERDIDDDAPPSAGHDEEMMDVVRERDAAHTEGVQEIAEREAEEGPVGPQDPRDPEVADDPERDEDTETDQQRHEREQHEPGTDPQPDKGNDPDRGQAAPKARRKREQ